MRIDDQRQALRRKAKAQENVAGGIALISKTELLQRRVRRGAEIAEKT
jgi:hypothetical protein